METITCDQCNLLMINGVLCHETGCPDSWRFIKKECKWCGSEFEPEHADEGFCSCECIESYYG